MREQLVTENRQKFQKVAKVRFGYKIHIDMNVSLYTNMNIKYSGDMETNRYINMHIDVDIAYHYKQKSTCTLT